MSFPRKLTTENEAIRLIKPDVERDAEFAVNWLKGEIGKNTLLLMGNTTKNITEPTLEFEKKRVSEFLENGKQYNWMIEVEGIVVGTVWADLEPSEYVPAPAVHIMIGDPEVRGQGIGPSAMQRVIDYLKEEYLKEPEQNAIYTRHLVENAGAAKLLEKLNFVDLGEPYTDKDGLKWQNAILDMRSEEQK